jgi:hypothetical protein
MKNYLLSPIDLCGVITNYDAKIERTFWIERLWLLPGP